jgi:hypothetical protein
MASVMETEIATKPQADTPNPGARVIFHRGQVSARPHRWEA